MMGRKAALNLQSRTSIPVKLEFNASVVFIRKGLVYMVISTEYIVISVEYMVWNCDVISG